MAKKTSYIIGLIFGLAIISMGIMAVISGEESAKGWFLWLPMLFGLVVTISNIIALAKKEPQQTTQPLQPTAQPITTQETKTQ